MDLGVIPVLSQLHQKHLDLLTTPAQSSRKRRHSQRLQSRGCIDVIPLAKLLVLLVLGPMVGRPLVARLNNINESDLFQHILEVSRTFERAVELSGCFVEKSAPFVHGMIFLEGAIVAAHDDIDILQFNVAAWSQVPVCVSMVDLVNGEICFTGRSW